jgi:hypothetical protein
VRDKGFVVTLLCLLFLMPLDDLSHGFCNGNRGIITTWQHQSQ